ncbi:hypothetical protein [Neptuniibacter sp.]|uniref:hypothetical protein n=1 Tax=Neptuniibacter sp. TaxID=1962643 RepID=UPI002630C100|nr:hypothetical protein [Neptuniibacter sp.]MCP4595336.1 hypothetical protein [Neptuniibacter sp.]
MTITVTGSYASSDQIKMVFDDLIAKGIPREQVFIDTYENAVKVMTADNMEWDIERILRTHGVRRYKIRRKSIYTLLG